MNHSIGIWKMRSRVSMICTKKRSPKAQRIFDELNKIYEEISEEFDKPDHGEFYELRSIFKGFCNTNLISGWAVLPAKIEKFKKGEKEKYIDFLLATRKGWSREDAEKYLEQFEWE